MTDHHIDITHTERGFEVYGDDVIDVNGSQVSVHESSVATDDYCWLTIKGDVYVQEHQRPEEVAPGQLLYHEAWNAAHLNREAAQAIVARLQLWLDRHPEDPS